MSDAMSIEWRALRMMISCVLVLQSSLTASLNNEPRLRNHGYIQRKASEMRSRGYNADPYEVNVDGEDNLFSRDDCSPDFNGMFGSDEGTDQSLEFYYQVETLPLDDTDQATREILNKVETSVSKTLLPSLFRDTCALAAIRSRMSNEEPHRHLVEMKGITTLPEDTVLQGVECEGELSNELNDCVVVDGRMTLYSTGAIDVSFLDSVRSVIRLAMTEGDYNNQVDPRIVNVSYRDSLDTEDSSNVETTTKSGEGNGESSLPPYAWAFIGIGVVAVLLAVGALFSRRNRGGQYSDTSIGSFPSQEVDEPIT